MGIIDRLKNLAEAEIADIKRVLRETDGDPAHAAEAEAARRKKTIADAEAELARANAQLAEAERTGESNVAPGQASAAGAAHDASGAVVAAPARTVPPVPAVAQRDVGGAYPRALREAYATLGLPLGSDRARVLEALAALEARYRDPLFASQLGLTALALDHTARARQAARDLDDWFARPR